MTNLFPTPGIRPEDVQKQEEAHARTFMFFKRELGQRVKAQGAKSFGAYDLIVAVRQAANKIEDLLRKSDALPREQQIPFDCAVIELVCKIGGASLFMLEETIDVVGETDPSTLGQN